MTQSGQGGERTETDSTASGAELLDTSLLLMLLLIFGLLLSFLSLLLQRRELAAEQEGTVCSAGATPALLRRVAGILTLWCGGAFFLLSLNAAHSAEGTSTAALSRVDLSASLLALAAAFLRLWVIERGTENGGVQGAESGSLLPHLIFDSLPA